MAQIIGKKQKKDPVLMPNMKGRKNKNIMGKVQGTSLFQIVPEGMDEGFKDKFAALGYDEENEEMDGNEVEYEEEIEDGGD